MLSEASCIDRLDLTDIQKRLVEKEKWSPEDAAEAVRRYKNFLLLLCKYPDQVLAPAPDMDEAWHAHILFTRKYMEDCQNIFGEYLHHTPAQSSDEEENKAMEKAQVRTANLYLKEFHESYFLELNVSTFW